MRVPQVPDLAGGWELRRHRIAFGPWFHLPLPVRCTTVVLPPIGPLGSGPDAADDEVLVQRLYDEVNAVMQETLTRLARPAPSV